MAIQIDTIRDYPKCGSRINNDIRAYWASDYWKGKGKKKSKAVKKTSK